MNNKSIAEPTKFLKKVFKMLSSSENTQTISWTDSGTEFIIHSLTKFTEKILPRYFKHCNYASFVRQLNMYDFHKMKMSKEVHSYSHPLFLKHCPNMLSEIHRKTTNVLSQVKRKKYQIAGLHAGEIMEVSQEQRLLSQKVLNLRVQLEELGSSNRALREQLTKTEELTEKIDLVFTELISFITLTISEDSSGIFQFKNHSKGVLLYKNFDSTVVNSSFLAFSQVSSHSPDNSDLLDSFLNFSD